MREIEIKGIDGVDILKTLSTILCTPISDHCGEYIIEVDNECGQGSIRAISFNWGVSLLDFDIIFNDSINITFEIEDVSPLSFIFVTDGTIVHGNNQIKEKTTINPFQNVIVSSEINSKDTYQFSKDQKYKVNIIYILKQEYVNKTNNNLSFLTPSLYEAFTSKKNSPFRHFGNFNLKIADKIKELNANEDSGIVRSLTIEGQLYLILAMQILEHHNYNTGQYIPESLSKAEIKKIHELSGYIIDNISENLSVNGLALQAGMNVKKLQTGFRLLYSKSVNEYVRELKLEIARDHIKNTDFSISEIVYQIGLKSRSYFSKIFFDKYGILPTEYRKKNKNNDNLSRGSL